MRTTALFSVVALTFASACTQLLGIDERGLRDDAKTDDNGSPIGGAEAGTGSSSDAGADAKQLLDDGGLASRGSGEPPVASFSALSIDFGQVYCGADAPAERVLHVVNSGGDGELDWQASFGPTSVFSIDGPSAGQIDAANDDAAIKIASTGVPAFATAGQTETAILTVTISRDGANPVATDITVTQSAAGATLLLEPASASFGQVQTGSSATPIPVTLQNIGNLPISVGFASSTDPQLFLVNATGTTLGPSEQITGLAAMFEPTSAGTASSRIAIVPGNTPMCGAVPSGIDLNGTGTVGPIAVQPGSLDFGLVDCNKQSSAQQIQITTTGAQLSWTASLGKGGSSPYVISPTAGSASSASAGVITVAPRPIPQAADVTTDAFADTLTIMAPDGPHAIPLHETAHGAILSQSTSSLAFGGVNTGAKATTQLNVVNTGNAPAVVSYSVTDSAFAIAPQNATVGGQGSSSLTTVTFSPSATKAYAASATMSVSPATVLCAALPNAVALTGVGTTSYVSVSPTTLDFGLVNCGSTGPKKTITVSNTAPRFTQPFTWSATLGKGSSSPFKLSSTSATISGQGSSSVDVTPLAVPSMSPTDADYYADTLTITTNAANDSPHVISLHETAQGAILALSPTSLSFGSVAAPATSTQSFQLVNTGNFPATKVSLSLGSNTYFSLGASSNITVNGGSSVTDTATFKPSKGGIGAKATWVTPSFSGANCGGTPTSLTLSGTSI